MNDTVGGSNKITGKSFSRKIQRKTATRKERRKKSSKKKVSYQTTKGGKYIKNLSNRKLTDAQIRFNLSRSQIYTSQQIYGLKNRSKLFWGISDLGNTIHGVGNE